MNREEKIRVQNRLRTRKRRFIERERKRLVYKYNSDESHANSFSIRNRLSPDIQSSYNTDGKFISICKYFFFLCIVVYVRKKKAQFVVIIVGDNCTLVKIV